MQAQPHFPFLCMKGRTVSNPTSETVVATYTVRGREFEITRRTWRDTDGLSFDVTDKLTGAPLHNESFGTQPEVPDVDELLHLLATEVDSTGKFADSLLASHHDALVEVLNATIESTEVDEEELNSYEVSIKFVVEAADESSAEDAAQTYLNEHRVEFNITQVD
jgi:hypothetical protein